MKILVVGGAGYIGSHMSKILHNNGHEVVVLDDLSTGFLESVRYGEFIHGNLKNLDLLDDVFLKYKFDGVMHFAASSLVGESVTNPSKYFKNNVCNSLNLFDAMVRHKVSNLVFSSSAAIFGNPEYLPIDEKHPKKPINSYGSSKLMIEIILKDYAKAYGLKSASLRYFNAAGADLDQELGEKHDPETHLIPLILKAATGERESICIYGNDYNTHDGTCIRDYIHVNDICNAHTLALDFLISQNKSCAEEFNLGNGQGFSIEEVISCAQNCVKKDKFEIDRVYGDRREGDPDVLISNSEKAENILGWKIEHSSLNNIVNSAWNFERKR
jgi:UDP-glucose 4-epimerase